MKLFLLTAFLSLISCCVSIKPITEHKNKLYISFYSVGDGIDYKMKVEFDKMIKNYERKNAISLSIAERPWGKEGELDYCIDLSILSRKKQQSFIEATKQLLASGSYIKINEVENCKH